MRTVLLASFIFAVGVLQLTLPSNILPGSIVPDLILLLAISLALSDEPPEHLPWLALLAGLSLDIWLPTTFGTWTLAALASMYVTLGIKARAISKIKLTSVIFASLIGIIAGLVIVGISESMGGSFSVTTGLFSFIRIFVPKILFDVILAWPMYLLVRSIVRGLRGGSSGVPLQPQKISSPFS